MKADALLALLAVAIVLVLLDAPGMAYGGLLVFALLLYVSFVVFMRFMQWLFRKTTTKHTYFRFDPNEQKEYPAESKTPSHCVDVAANRWLHGKDTEAGSFEYEKKQRKATR